MFCFCDGVRISSACCNARLHTHYIMPSYCWSFSTQAAARSFDPSGACTSNSPKPRHLIPIPHQKPPVQKTLTSDLVEAISQDVQPHQRGVACPRFLHVTRRSAAESNECDKPAPRLHLRLRSAAAVAQPVSSAIATASSISVSTTTPRTNIADKRLVQIIDLPGDHRDELVSTPFEEA
jgi:hypothetical protein